VIAIVFIIDTGVGCLLKEQTNRKTLLFQDIVVVLALRRDQEIPAESAF
jgi:hypothetical protein